MKKLIIAMCMMIFSVCAVQAEPIGAGSGGYSAEGWEDRVSLNEQYHGTAAGVAVVQNANFERLYGMGAATVVLAGKSTYIKMTIHDVAATSHGVLGGGSIGISKETSY